jgi:hypothetical protein
MGTLSGRLAKLRLASINGISFGANSQQNRKPAMSRFMVLAVLAPVFAWGFMSSEAQAQAPTVTDAFSTLVNESANNGNFATGAKLVEKANVTSPLPFLGSVYGFMTQGSTLESLFIRPDAVNPNWITATVPYLGPASTTFPTGPWTLDVSTTQNFTPSTTTLINTPAVGSVGIMPFVNSMTITAGSTPLTPTVSWVLPSTAGTDVFGTPLPTISGVGISVADITNKIQVTNVNPIPGVPATVPYGSSFQQANVIYNSPGFLPSTTSLTIPTTDDNPDNSNFGQPLLQYGNTYQIQITLANVTPGSTPVPGCEQCNLDSLSHSIFDYTPINPVSLGLPPTAIINLPKDMTPIPTTSGLFAPELYKFQVANVGPSTGVTYIDPAAAYGFVYTIGLGNPNFASVNAITNVGTGIYQLLVWDGTKYDLVDSSLAAGFVFNFLTNGFANGVSQFEIIGIDPGVDPTDITAFVTALTFTSDGAFTGTMEALVEDNTTPLPSALPLFATGLGVVALFARRRKRKNIDAIAAA